MEYSRNNPQGSWRHGTSRLIEEMACGNSRGQLKELEWSSGDEWNGGRGWEWWRKNHMEFPGVLVFELELLEFPSCVIQFCGIGMSEALFCVEFPKIKWLYITWKFQGFQKKSCSKPETSPV